MAVNAKLNRVVSFLYKEAIQKRRGSRIEEEEEEEGAYFKIKPSNQVVVEGKLNT